MRTRGLLGLLVRACLPSSLCVVRHHAPHVALHRAVRASHFDLIPAGGALFCCCLCGVPFAFCLTVNDSGPACEPHASSPASYRPRVPGSERRAGFGGRGSGGESVAKRVALATLFFASLHDCLPFSFCTRPCFPFAPTSFHHIHATSSLSPLPPLTSTTPPCKPPMSHVDQTDDAFTILSWWRPQFQVSTVATFEIPTLLPQRAASDHVYRGTRPPGMRD